MLMVLVVISVVDVLKVNYMVDILIFITIAFTFIFISFFVDKSCNGCMTLKGTEKYVCRDEFGRISVSSFCPTCIEKREKERQKEI